MKTYLDKKNKIIVTIAHTRDSGKIQCRCIKTGMFCWRDSIKELVPVEHWMFAY